MERVKAILVRIHSDSLYRNSLYLIASQAVLAGLGFLFWVINARLFTPEQIGLATTLISVVNFITGFSMLGFNSATIRYLPTEKDKNTFSNTAFAVASLGAIVLTILFLLFIPLFSPPLLFIRNSLLFMASLVIFMVVATLNNLTDSIFIAFRDTKYVLIVNSAAALTKLMLPWVFFSLGTYGIFYAYISAVNVSMFLSMIFLTVVFSIRFLPMISWSVVRRVWRFTAGNYLAGLISMLSGSITPILITNILGPAYTAFYYMPSMITNLLNSIPQSFSKSMYAEGSHDSRQLWALFLRSLRAIWSVMIPAGVLLGILSPYILGILGKSYSDEGLGFLRLSLINGVISVPNSLFGSILNIRKQVRLIMILSIVGSIISLMMTYLFLPYGITALGWSGVLVQIIMFAIHLLVYAIFLKK